MLNVVPLPTPLFFFFVVVVGGGGGGRDWPFAVIIFYFFYLGWWCGHFQNSTFWVYQIQILKFSGYLFGVL